MEPKLLTYFHAKGRELGNPVAGTFELTARCNFNCKMCYVHLTDREQRRRGRELTAQQWLTLGEEAKKAGMLFLLLTGGEPTLRGDFLEIYRGLKKMGFLISVNSNGYLLQDDILELLAQDRPSRVNVTLYGVNDETYRRLCGVSAYDRIIRNITNLRKVGVEVKLNLSITPDNAPELPELLKEAKRLGANVQASPYMFPPIRREESMVGENFRMTGEEAGAFQAQYQFLTMTEDQFCLLADQMSQGVAQGVSEDCMELVGRKMRCRGGSTSFWITWDGKMMPCGQMNRPAFSVEELGFHQAWQALRQATAEIRLPKACANCSLNFLCHACAAMCLCETGKFDEKPEYLCRLNRSYLETTLRLWKEKYGGRKPNAPGEA